MSDEAKQTLLVIEDDQDLAELLASFFRKRNFRVELRPDALGPLARVRKAPPGTRAPWDAVLTDLRIPGVDGFEFIREMHLLDATLPIVLMTAHGGVDTAVTAVREGAYDFVLKPLNFPELAVTVDRAIGHRKLQEENRQLRAVIETPTGLDGVIAKSQAMRTVCDLVRRIAPTSATVLINGESGTGKEVIARALHECGPRKDKAFIAINCAAIPENLLESELFGYGRGAFTGAADKKVGLFEEANEGTLFLDEIGDLSGSLQAKLLRVLQERKIRRLGETQSRAIDVRIVAATHRVLATEVREGRFREDLFFRLNVIPIRIPPLRDRTPDVLPLAEHFLRRFAAMNGRTLDGFSKDAIEELCRRQWKGNVRELENAIERAVVLADGPQLTARDLSVFSDSDAELNVVPPTATATVAPAPTQFLPSGVDSNAEVSSDRLLTLEEVELRYVAWVLAQMGGVKERARRVLGIDRKTLYKKIEKLALQEDGVDAPFSEESRNPAEESSLSS